MSYTDTDKEALIEKLKNDLLPREDAWNLINDLNEEAHSEVYEEWTDADTIEEQADQTADSTEQEKLYDQAEEMRGMASENQAEYFLQQIHNLSEKEYASICYYAKYDNDFKDQYEQFTNDNIW